MLLRPSKCRRYGKYVMGASRGAAWRGGGHRVAGLGTVEERIFTALAGAQEERLSSHVVLLFLLRSLTLAPNTRLHGLLAHLSGPAGSPNTTMSTTKKLPTYDELPAYKNFNGCAWGVWGDDDQLGTVNLLTPEVVKEASREIKCVACQSRDEVIANATYERHPGRARRSA